MSQKFEESILSGPHFKLQQLVGVWQGTSRVWFGEDNLVDESFVSGEIKEILSGRFVEHAYVGSMQGVPLDGRMIIGYHLELMQYQAWWVDSFHNNTAMMFCTGVRGDTAIKVTGSYTYVTLEKEHVWGWRTEINMPNANQLMITAYNISPDGEETKATEIAYFLVEKS